MRKSAPTFITSLLCSAIASIAMVSANGCVQEASIPSSFQDAKTESAVLNLQFHMDLAAEKDLGDCLMEYRIGPGKFATRYCDGGTVIVLTLPGEPCRKISANTAGAYRAAALPKERGIASLILSHSIAQSVDKIILPLLRSDSGTRHDCAVAVARALLKQDVMIVTGRLKYGSRFAGSLRLTPEGRRRLEGALVKEQK